MSDRSGGAPLVLRWRIAARVGALVLPLVTCAILATLRESITTATAVLILVLWVVAAAASGDRLAGLLAAVSGGAWFDFFLTEPYQRFTIAAPDDIEATILLVLIGACVSEIALWGHRQQGRAARRSGYLDGVLGTAQVVSEGETPPTALIEIVARQITDVLGADGCRWQPGPVHDARVAVLDHEGGLTRGDHTVDVDRRGLPTDEYVAVVVRSGSLPVGHFLVTATTKVAYPNREQRRVAVLLADQVAGAAGSP